MSEMSTERRTLLAFVLAMSVLMVWGYFYKPPVPPPPAPSSPAPQQAAPAPVPSVAPAAVSSATIAASEEKIVTISDDLYRVQISNRGAVVRSWQLVRYRDDSHPPRTLDLVNADVAAQVGGWPFSITLDDPKLEAEANAALYRIAPDAPEIHPPAEVKFSWSDGHLSVTKQLSFVHSYVVEVSVEAALDGKPLPVGIAWCGGFGDRTVYLASQQTSVFYHQGGKLNVLPVKKLGLADHSDLRLQQATDLDYTGIEDQFFAAAFLSDGAPLTLWHWRQDAKFTEDGKEETQPVAQMAAGTAAAAPLKMRVYVGPKALGELSAQKPSLEELIQYGWTGIIAKPLFEVLKWLHNWVPNWGWSIVVLTLIINMALFPLKMKSWRSMQKMQRVMPEVKQIQDRYKKYSMRDPRRQEMNKEVMAVYNREGINPMGGCLPMLLQMPIWWALYRMLQGAIELRHAAWSGTWIHDLSAHDPYYILPILMTLTMYLMQKMTPATTADPTQQKMFQFMPLLFGFLFFRLSSGLNLYIFTSNLVGMGQQLYLNRTEPLPAKGGGGKPKKKK